MQNAFTNLTRGLSLRKDPRLKSNNPAAHVVNATHDLLSLANEDDSDDCDDGDRGGVSVASRPKIEKKQKKQKKVDENKKKKKSQIDEFSEILQDINEAHVEIARNLDLCKWSVPTAVQKQVISQILCGKNVLATAPTGSGKSGAYLIPLLVKLTSASAAAAPSKGVRSLILVPTKELVMQVFKVVKRLYTKNDLKVVMVNKKLLKNYIQSSESTPMGRVDIMISTPMRFLMIHKSNLIDISMIEVMILDEVDKLFDIETDNREAKNSLSVQTDEILSTCLEATKKNIQVCMLSATKNFLIKELAKKVLTNTVTVLVEPNVISDYIEQKFHYVTKESGKISVLRQILSSGVKPSVLIFVDSIKKGEILHNELIYDGLRIAQINGDQSDEVRDQIINRYRQGDIWVLICTDLMARGIDFKNVNLVINFDAPISATTYLHRIGRTGRAGRTGKAITFFTDKEAKQMKKIVTHLKAAGHKLDDWISRL